jgi:hypothetical protein
VRIVLVRIWPLEALRKISIVFDIFHLARKKSQRLRMLWAKCWVAWTISQWETIVSSCDFEQNGGKCKRFCQWCRCWVVFPTCAVKIHSWASCQSRRLAQQVSLVCGRLNLYFHKNSCNYLNLCKISHIVKNCKWCPIESAQNVFDSLWTIRTDHNFFGKYPTFCAFFSRKNITILCKIKLFSLGHLKGYCDNGLAGYSRPTCAFTGSILSIFLLCFTSGICTIRFNDNSRNICWCQRSNNHSAWSRTIWSSVEEFRSSKGRTVLIKYGKSTLLN